MQLSFNIFKKCKISFSPNGSPNMQRHRCRKDKESFSFLGRFHPGGATTLQCLQNIGQRWVAKYVSVSAQNWRESGSVGLHGAVSCLQFRPHKVCNRHTAHCTLLRSSDLRRLQTPAMGSVSGTHARPPPVPMNLQCDLCKKNDDLSQTV